MQSQVLLLQPASVNCNWLIHRHTHFPRFSHCSNGYTTPDWPVHFLWLIMVSSVADVFDFNSLCCSAGVWNTKALEINYWGVFALHGGRGDRDRPDILQHVFTLSATGLSHC